MNVTVRTPAGCEHAAHIHSYPTWEEVYGPGPSGGDPHALSLTNCKECGYSPGQYDIFTSSSTEPRNACQVCGLQDGSNALVAVQAI